MMASAELTPDFFAQLAAYRELITPVLRAALPAREPRKHLYSLIETHLARAGKGLRPALCIASCQAWGGQTEDALPAAAALEMLHNAFLIHDDIEDGSEYRRDQPAMYLQHGVPLAINTGDAMQALSLQMVRKSADRIGPHATWRLIEEFDHMLSESLEGQALEIGWVRDNACEVSEEDYLRMTLKKTCWYSFIHPCRIGALIARPEDADLQRFDRFGYLAGAAFQIQDDVLNLTGKRSQYGKEIGGDLWEGKRTLILVHLQRQLHGRELERLVAMLGKTRATRLPRDVAWVAERVQHCGSVEYARAVARCFAAAAQDAFAEAFGSAPASEPLRFLRAFVDYLVERHV